ncbi:hypothetical protein [Streptomyces sp.]|uniref:hypothetical protein n=1 Tax=Streptomyces sp. TaxID=1931 RepID=UPI002F91DBF4
MSSRWSPCSDRTIGLINSRCGAVFSGECRPEQRAAVFIARCVCVLCVLWGGQGERTVLGRRDPYVSQNARLNPVALEKPSGP